MDVHVIPQHQQVHVTAALGVICCHIVVRWPSYDASMTGSTRLCECPAELERLILHKWLWWHTSTREKCPRWCYTVVFIVLKAAYSGQSSTCTSPLNQLSNTGSFPQACPMLSLRAYWEGLVSEKEADKECVTGFAVCVCARVHNQVTDIQG